MGIPTYMPGKNPRLYLTAVFAEDTLKKRSQVLNCTKKKGLNHVFRDIHINTEVATADGETGP